MGNRNEMSALEEWKAMLKREEQADEEADARSRKGKNGEHVSEENSAEADMEGGDSASEAAVSSGDSSGEGGMCSGDGGMCSGEGGMSSGDGGMGM